MMIAQPARIAQHLPTARNRKASHKELDSRHPASTRKAGASLSRG